MDSIFRIIYTTVVLVVVFPVAQPSCPTILHSEGELVHLVREIAKANDCDSLTRSASSRPRSATSHGGGHQTEMMTMRAWQTIGRAFLHGLACEGHHRCPGKISCNDLVDQALRSQMQTVLRRHTRHSPTAASQGRYSGDLDTYPIQDTLQRPEHTPHTNPQHSAHVDSQLASETEGRQYSQLGDDYPGYFELGYPQTGDLSAREGQYFIYDDVPSSRLEGHPSVSKPNAYDDNEYYIPGVIGHINTFQNYPRNNGGRERSNYGQESSQQQQQEYIQGMSNHMLPPHPQTAWWLYQDRVYGRQQHPTGPRSPDDHSEGKSGNYPSGNFQANSDHHERGEVQVAAYGLSEKQQNKHENKSEKKEQPLGNLDQADETVRDSSWGGSRGKDGRESVEKGELDSLAKSQETDAKNESLLSDVMTVIPRHPEHSRTTEKERLPPELKHTQDRKIIENDNIQSLNSRTGIGNNESGNVGNETFLESTERSSDLDSKPQPSSTADVRNPRGKTLPNSTADVRKPRNETLPNSTADVKKPHRKPLPHSTADAKNPHNKTLPDSTADVKTHNRKPLPNGTADARKLHDKTLPNSTADVRKPHNKTLPNSTADARKPHNKTLPNSTADVRKPRNETLPNSTADVKRSHKNIQPNSTDAITNLHSETQLNITGDIADTDIKIHKNGTGDDNTKVDSKTADIRNRESVTQRSNSKERELRRRVNTSETRRRRKKLKRKGRRRIKSKRRRRPLRKKKPRNNLLLKEEEEHNPLRTSDEQQETTASHATRKTGTLIGNKDVHNYTRHDEQEVTTLDGMRNGGARPYISEVPYDDDKRAKGPHDFPHSNRTRNVHRPSAGHSRSNTNTPDADRGLHHAKAKHSHNNSEIGQRRGQGLDRKDDEDELRDRENERHRENHEHSHSRHNSDRNRLPLAPPPRIPQPRPQPTTTPPPTTTPTTTPPLTTTPTTTTTTFNTPGNQRAPQLRVEQQQHYSLLQPFNHSLVAARLLFASVFWMLENERCPPFPLPDPLQRRSGSNSDSGAGGSSSSSREWFPNPHGGHDSYLKEWMDHMCSDVGRGLVWDLVALRRALYALEARLKEVLDLLDMERFLRSFPGSGGVGEHRKGFVVRKKCFRIRDVIDAASREHYMNTANCHEHLRAIISRISVTIFTNIMQGQHPETNREPCRPDSVSQLFYRFGDAGAGCDYGNVLTVQGVQNLLDSIQDKNCSAVANASSGESQQKTDYGERREGHQHHHVSSHMSNSNSWGTVNSFSDQKHTARELMDAVLKNRSDTVTIEQFYQLCPSLLKQALLSSQPLDESHVEDDPQERPKIEFVVEATLLQTYGLGTAAVAVITVCSLLGAVMVRVCRGAGQHYAMAAMLGLAAGNLCGDAILHLVPEAFAVGHDHGVQGDQNDQHSDHDSEDDYYRLAGGLVVTHVRLKCLALLTTVYVFWLLEIFTSRHGEIEGASAKSGSQRPAVKNGRSRSTAGEGQTIPMSTLAESTEVTLPGQTRDSQGIYEVIPPQLLYQRKPTVVTETKEFKTSSRHLVWMIVVGDAIHNLADGLAIGAAFAHSIPLGLSTSLAVVCHEIPHELGDFAVLVSTGMKVRKALLLNLLSALTAFVGLYIGLAVGAQLDHRQWIFIVVAGMFLYVSLADLVPELVRYFHHFRNVRMFVVQSAGLLSGFMLMFLLVLLEDVLHF